MQLSLAAASGVAALRVRPARARTAPQQQPRVAMASSGEVVTDPARIRQIALAAKRVAVLGIKTAEKARAPPHRPFTCGAAREPNELSTAVASPPAAPASPQADAPAYRVPAYLQSAGVEARRARPPPRPYLPAAARRATHVVRRHRARR